MNLYEEFLELEKKIRKIEEELKTLVKNNSSALAEALTRLEKLEKEKK
jgi:cell division protein ZapA (FtsZ GTPase activity inhibitor)